MSHRGFARYAIDKRTDAVFAAQCDLAGKIAVPLAATGTGAGVLKMSIYSTAVQVAYLNGRGQFFSDAGGTTGASPVTSLAANAWTTLYIKVPSGSCNLVFANRSALTKWGDSSHLLILEAVNAPKINGFNIAYIGSSATSVRIYANLGYSIVSGSIAGLTELTYILLSGHSLTCSGSIAGLTDLTYLYLNGNSLTCTGSIAGLTDLTTLLINGNSLTCSGSIAGLTELTYVYLSGNSLTCSGSIAGLTELTSLYLVGGSLTCSGSIAGLTGLTSLYLNGNSLTCSGSITGLTKLTFLYFLGNSLTCSGSIAGLTKLTYLVLIGNSLTCTYNTTSGSSMRLTRRLYVSITSFTSAMIDAILIDTDNNTTAAIDTQPIYLVNGNAPTSASAAAIASLRAKGNTVTTS